MLGQVYLRYSDRFGKKPHSATLKRKLGQFKLSNLVFTLARINVLLGWRRMLGENREDKKNLQGLLVANFIDDDVLNAPLPPQLANEFLAGHPSPQVGHLPPDLVPIFSRQQVLNLLRLGILLCDEQGTLLTDGRTPREKVSRGVDVAPLAVLDIDTLEEMMPNLVAGDFTLEQCLNARALRDPGYRSMWYDFLLEHFPEFRRRKDEDLINKFGEIMDRGKARLFGSTAAAGSS